MRRQVCRSCCRGRGHKNIYFVMTEATQIVLRYCSCEVNPLPSFRPELCHHGKGKTGQTRNSAVDLNFDRKVKLIGSPLATVDRPRHPRCMVNVTQRKTPDFASKSMLFSFGGGLTIFRAPHNSNVNLLNHLLDHHHPFSLSQPPLIPPRIALPAIPHYRLTDEDALNP